MTAQVQQLTPAIGQLQTSYQAALAAEQTFNAAAPEDQAAALADLQAKGAAFKATATQVLGAVQQQAPELIAQMGGAGALNLDAITLPSQAAPLMQQIATTMGAVQTQLNQAKSDLDDAAAQLAEKDQELAAARAQLDAVAAQLAQKDQELAAGLEKLLAGERDFANGMARLTYSGEELEEGKAALDAAAAQLAEGKAAYDSGMERLGPDFSYMKNDKIVDLDKGLEAVAAARAYAEDLTGRVTKELTGRAVASIGVMAASVLSLLTGLVGVAGKKIRILGWIAVAGCAAAVVLAVVSGFRLPFSRVAGSGFQTFLLLAGPVVNAVAAGFGAVLSKPAPAAVE